MFFLAKCPPVSFALFYIVKNASLTFPLFSFYLPYFLLFRSYYHAQWHIKPGKKVDPAKKIFSVTRIVLPRLYESGSLFAQLTLYSQIKEDVFPELFFWGFGCVNKVEFIFQFSCELLCYSR